MKISKKILSLLLLICLIAVTVPTTNIQAAVKLNKSKVSIYVGKTYQLKLNGTTKKVTWSSNKTSVATVTSKGKVTGKKAGVAKITAKVNSKKYVCTVTVKKKAVTDYNKKISYEAFETSKNLVVTFYNENSANVRLEANIVFKDAAGKLLSQEKEYVSCFQNGKHTTVIFSYPRTADYDYADYSSYNITYTATAIESYYKSYVSSVQISSNIGSSNDVIAECVNAGSKTINYLQFTCIYYKDGNVVGSDSEMASSLAAGTSTMLTFHAPYDRDYEDIAYDTYKIYTDYAFTIA